MAVNTLLIDFSVDPTETRNESQVSTLATNVEKILRDYLSNLKLMNTFIIDGGIFKLYTSDFGATTNLRIFNNGLITVNIEYYKDDKQEPLLTYEVIGPAKFDVFCYRRLFFFFFDYLFTFEFQQSKQLEQCICMSLNCFRTKLFPPLKRGASLDVYLTSSGSNLIIIIIILLINNYFNFHFFFIIK